MSRSIFFLTWKDQGLASQAFDSYVSAVVVAFSESAARAYMQARTADEGLYALNPNWRNLVHGHYEQFNELLQEFTETRSKNPFWVSDEFSSCQVIGTATEDAPDGVICTSFANS